MDYLLLKLLYLKQEPFNKTKLEGQSTTLRIEFKSVIYYYNNVAHS